MLSDRTRQTCLAGGVAAVLLAGACLVFGWSPLPVVDDPLVRMPGTQPGQVVLPDPSQCLNCHADYDLSIEPGFNWRGSMMAQAARDFLFWACFTVSAQDSIWALGTANATDICERCHFPTGWLDGRSDPTNASLMAGADYDGVHCGLCHRMWDPFFETTWAGTREGDDWLGYWDETNLSVTPAQPAADTTRPEDASLAAAITTFGGSPFFVGDVPPPGYTENASGQYFVSPTAHTRASFADAAARHQVLYSRTHKSKFFCSTCHDVANPILANLGLSGLPDDGSALITEQYSAARFFHVERTFSEFMLSDYGQPGGAPTNPELQAQGATDITHAAKCQDCHMPDVVGRAARMNISVVRPDGSVEHPQSGLPLHDMTGGNAWVGWVLASTVPGSPNHDPVNAQQLGQGPAVLTLDLTQGLALDPAALLAAVDRALGQLRLAATITDASYDPATGDLSFRILNNGAHRLPSGFPEGRRMFANIRVLQGGALIHEINPYDGAAATLKGLDYPYLEDPTGTLLLPQPLTAGEAHIDELVYEMKPSSKAEVPNTGGAGLTGEAKTFHFALATGRYKDNRIPPRGFDSAAAPSRLVETVYTVKNPDGTYTDVGGTTYTAAELDGGYDEIALTLPAGADRVEVNLYYQTTSREYVEFLRDEINGAGNLTLSSPTPSGEPSAYIARTDPFFDRLRAWGDTVWALWTHNAGVPGAAPVLMTSAVIDVLPACGAPAPTLLSALPAPQQVTLTWSDEHAADPTVTGYRLYRDEAGQTQLVAVLGLVTTATDSGLVSGQEVCYTVTATTADCESGLSNVLCATPSNQTTVVGVDSLATAPGAVFTAGALVTFEAHVVDGSGVPVAGAVVDLAITGPMAVNLTSGTSDSSGIARATWQTRWSGRNRTPAGTYTATVRNVSQGTATWDGTPTTTTFIVQ